jgi:hypothetical protein
MEKTNKLMLVGGILLILGFLISRLAQAVQQNYEMISLVFSVSAWIMLGVGFIFGVIAMIDNFKS